MGQTKTLLRLVLAVMALSFGMPLMNLKNNTFRDSIFLLLNVPAYFILNTPTFALIRTLLFI
jgi:hypothetical protein